MPITTWLLFTILALFCFGVVGLLQKLSTDLVSAESALVWLIVGFLLLAFSLYYFARKPLPKSPANE